MTDVRVFEWSSTRNHFLLITNVSMLSPVKSYPTWPVSPDPCLPLRCTRGDSLQGICHPERSEVGYVILSAAKDLRSADERPFAALRVTACRGYVILSAAKDLVRPSRQTLRCTQSLPSEKRRGDSLQGICHPERSEGSRADFWGITRATDC